MSSSRRILTTTSIEGRMPTDPHPGFSAFGRAVLKPIRRSIAWVQSRYQVSRAIHALEALDDHVLADIGVYRGEIEHAVRHDLREGGERAAKDAIGDNSIMRDLQKAAFGC